MATVVEQSPALETALNLASLGFAVFPCAPGAKRPANENGLTGATTDIEQIEAWWDRWPDANVAIRTDGLVVLDLDPIDGRPNPWISDQPERYIDLAIAPLSQTPRGGRHYFFRQPVGRPIKCSQSKIAPKVDVRGDGGYVLVAPSVVNGKPYTWPLGELDCAPHKLPEPPGWLLDLLDPPTKLESVRAEVAAPSNKIPSGQRNGALTSLGGAMRHYGMSQAEIAAALRRVNLDRCTPPLDDAEVDKIAWSVGRYEPDQSATAVAERHAEQDFGDVKDSGPIDPGPFPAELLHVPGFIGDVMAFSLETAFTPQPELALAAALPLQGVLAGRKVQDNQGGRTNVYTLGVCESGGGKERARQVNKEVLYRSGLQHLIGPEGFASHVGILNAVEHQPSILFQWDEIGRIWRTTGDARNSHLYQVPTIMMQLFSNSASVYICPAYADREKNKSIDQPHACLYGTTVPQSLYEGLTPENVTDGFVSRLLIFEASNGDPEPQEPIVSDVPDRILQVARWWGDFKPIAGNLADQHPKPLVVPYTADATAFMADLRVRSRAEKQKTEARYATLWTRTTEKARKLALLYACSADHLRPIVTLEAAEWAARVSEYLTRRMTWLASRWIAENRQESNSKRVLRIIEQNGRIDRSTLTRLTQWLTKRERDEVLATLSESGSIRTETQLSATRPATVYASTAIG